jgi:CRP-like cAMP-binding protein
LHCELASFNKGESLFSEDEKRLGILLSGKAVALPSEDSRGALRSFSAGELFGAAAIFCDDGRPPFSLIVAKTACRVLFISREGVEELFLKEPRRAIEYIPFLSGRVEFLNRRIGTFTSPEASVRLARYILKTSERGVCRNINFTALAKTLGISRASLYRAKNELIELNAISVEGRTITLLDTEALNNIK